MAKKGIIIYSSMGGNTKKIAERFKQVFEKKGWECDIFKIDKRTDVKHPPFKLDDYDLVCVGSLIIQGLPTREIYDDHNGVLMPDRILRNPPPPPMEFTPVTEGYGPKRGVVFVTYGGQRRGPVQAEPAFTIMENRLEDMKIKVIGRFACPGGHKVSRIPVDRVAAATKWDVDVAAAALAMYREDPNHAQFASLTPQQREAFERAKNEAETLPITPEVIGERGTHWDIDHRPNDRDLLKAEIFMEEIIEDFFGGGVVPQPFSQHICVS